MSSGLLVWIICVSYTHKLTHHTWDMKTCKVTQEERCCLDQVLSTVNNQNKRSTQKVLLRQKSLGSENT